MSEEIRKINRKIASLRQTKMDAPPTLLVYQTEYDNGNSGTSKTIDWRYGNLQKISLNGSCTFTFTDPPGPARLTFKILRASGSLTPVFPSNVLFDESASLTSTINYYNIITMIFDGTYYFAVVDNLRLSKSDSTGTVTEAEEEQGSTAWTSEGNITASDNTYATCAIAALTTSYVITMNNMGFTIPTNASIKGIKVDIERKAQKASAGDNILDYVVRLENGFTENKSAGAVWPTTEATATYGGATDLWGGTPTATNINFATFGVSVGVIGDEFIVGTNTASIDCVTVTVYYTV